jgi:hypothetical protein
VALTIALLLLPALTLRSGAVRAGSSTVAAVADTFVNKSSAGTAYGTQATLLVDSSPVKRTYLRFDASGVPGTIVGARLRLSNKTAHSVGIVVRPVVSVTWPETTTTWRNAPPLATGAVSSGSLPAGWVELDVTSVLRWSNRLVSLALTTTSKTGLTFDSRSTARPPQLIVTTSTPSPSASASSVPSTTPTATISPSPSATPTATTSPSPSATPSATPTAYIPPERTEPLVAAAGDISCPPTDKTNPCQAPAVSEQLLAGQPNLVLALGDNQYPNGELKYYRNSYATSWGRLLSVTRPVPGNHEYQLDTTAAGYYTYFGAAAGDPTQGWYSFDVGGWHIVALNSNCSFIGGCGAGSAQLAWLTADLAAHATDCTLAYWHHPRWSSGEHGANPSTDPFWQTLQSAGADLVLNGHDHDYERFAHQLPDGTVDPTGIREFVVGTGGKSLRPATTLALNSELTDGTSFGALWLTLRPDGYDWRFTSTAGIDVDAGSDTCSPAVP